MVARAFRGLPACGGNGWGWIAGSGCGRRPPNCPLARNRSRSGSLAEPGPEIARAQVCLPAAACRCPRPFPPQTDLDSDPNSPLTRPSGCHSRGVYDRRRAGRWEAAAGLPAASLRVGFCLPASLPQQNRAKDRKFLIRSRFRGDGGRRGKIPPCFEGGIWLRCRCTPTPPTQGRPSGLLASGARAQDGRPEALCLQGR